MDYELMLVLEGQIPEDLAKEVLNKVKKLIEESGGKITLEDFWGRRKLAYKIGHQEHGYYDVLNFTADPEIIKKIENEIKLIGEVVRYLIVKKPKKVLEKPKSEKKKEMPKVLKEEKEEGVEESVEKIEEKNVEEPVEKPIEKPTEEPKVENLEEKPEEKKEKKKEKEELKELDKKLDEILKE